MSRNHKITTSTIALQVFTDQPLRLTVVHGKDKGRNIPLFSKSIVIGTSETADFILSDKLISPRHAILIPEGDWWLLRDLDSENGSFLNGKLVKRSAVFPGEKILMGNTELRLEYAPGPDDISLVKRRGEWFQIPRIISHELRNYLEFLDIGVEHLRRHPLIEKQLSGEIKTLEMAASKMDELLHALRDGCIPPRIKRLDITELMWEQAALLDSISEVSNIPIRWNIKEGPVWINADSGQLGRCVLNLVKNALEACKSGDHVEVTLTSEENSIDIIIEDTGCGMDTETLESMWVPLFTMKEHGTGMGAFIARTVVQRHGGTITAESTLKKGTTIRIRLPMNTRKAEYE